MLARTTQDSGLSEASRLEGLVRMSVPAPAPHAAGILKCVSVCLQKQQKVGPGLDHNSISIS